jgi:hypothetical protein
MICQWFSIKTTGTVCQWFVLKTTETVFYGLASKLVATVFFGLTLKLVATVSPGLASKPVARVFRFGPQNRQLWFGNLGLKINAMNSWFVLQNQADFSLLVAHQNQRENAMTSDTR